MHSDAAEVRCGATLGFEEVPGLLGFVEGQGFWGAEDRAH